MPCCLLLKWSSASLPIHARSVSTRCSKLMWLISSERWMSSYNCVLMINYLTWFICIRDFAFSSVIILWWILLFGMKLLRLRGFPLTVTVRFTCGGNCPPKLLRVQECKNCLLKMTLCLGHRAAETCACGCRTRTIVNPSDKSSHQWPHCILTDAGGCVQKIIVFSLPNLHGIII